MDSAEPAKVWSPGLQPEFEKKLQKMMVDRLKTCAKLFFFLLAYLLQDIAKGVVDWLVAYAPQYVDRVYTARRTRLIVDSRFPGLGFFAEFVTGVFGTLIYGLGIWQKRLSKEYFIKASRQRRMQGERDLYVKGLGAYSRAVMLDQLCVMWMPAELRRVARAVDGLWISVTVGVSFGTTFSASVWWRICVLFTLLAVAIIQPLYSLTGDDRIELRWSIYSPIGNVSWGLFILLFITYAAMSHAWYSQFRPEYLRFAQDQSRKLKEAKIAMINSCAVQVTARDRMGSPSSTKSSLTDRASTGGERFLDSLSEMSDGGGSLDFKLYSEFLKTANTDPKLWTLSVWASLFSFPFGIKSYHQYRIVTPVLSAVCSVFATIFWDTFVDPAFVTSTGSFSCGHYCVTLSYVGATFFFFCVFMVVQIVEVSTSGQRPSVLPLKLTI